MTDMTIDEARTRLLDAAIPHVPFDGWTRKTLAAAAREAEIEQSLADLVFPSPVDMALAYHRRGDAEMLARLASEDLSALRIRDKVAHAVRTRLLVVQKEPVRRGVTLFSLPMNGLSGSRALWDTVDAVWTAIGDTSDDYNWYTKRATLSGVYGATVLYWLGDSSPGDEKTWGFLDRRIEGIMQFEKVKSAVEKSPLGKAFAMGPGRLLSRIRPPARARTAETPAPGTDTADVTGSA